MPEYKEIPVAGRSYRRCRYITLNDTLNAPKEISFTEQEVIHVGVDTICRDTDRLTLSVTPDNAGEEFDLIDPATGEPAGTLTYAYLYAVLYSAYRASAKARDSKLLAQQTGS